MRRLRFETGCWLVLGVAALQILGCSNNPYPESDSEQKILYTSYTEAPRSMDPAFSYTADSHIVMANIYETLFEYHYLKRPYELIPGMAKAIPSLEPRPGGRVAYVIELREGMLFQEDPSFELGGDGVTSREVVADDFAFELARIADPRVNSPVIHNFGKIVGFQDFTERLTGRRKQDPAFAALPVNRQYREVGPIEGVVVHDAHKLEIILSAPYPQILYWLSMPFATPVPWEAVEYYDGREGRPRFADHPVGAGPYKMASYDKQFRIVLEKNPNWYGIQHPEWKAPGATYPAEGEEIDVQKGRVSPELAGRSLPFLDRIEFRREKESIPRFNKFIQGYYDKSGIIKESYDTVMQGDKLSPEMEAMGIQLDEVVELNIFYLGFNMEDSVVGEAGGERSRKLRQAMSLAIDSQEYIDLFRNGRGLSAQSPLPPGLFGFDPEYRNPNRELDIERARQLLAEAGFPDGIDPETGKPLQLTFDTAATSAAGLIQIRYFVDAWRKIGLDVEIASTTYNKFQEKVRSNVHQIFQWGWIADYPDPENFLFILTSAMAEGEAPNSANFRHERFDALFEEMKSRENDAERYRLIREMMAIFEHEAPWIPLLHSESLGLYQAWLSQFKPPAFVYPTAKYQDIDPVMRSEMREDRNRPVMWPAYALALITIVILVPGFKTLIEERQ
jgi:oligopeptide transport system substrate-binding protein